MSEFNPSILCLQETNFRDLKTHTLRKFNGYHNNRQIGQRASGGVSIYVKDIYESQIIPLTTNIEAVAVSIKIPNKVNICNIYIPPNYDLQANELKDLIEQIPTPRIIVGDFNAHNPSWGSKESNRKGRVVETTMNDLNINILNDGSNTRFNSFSGEFSAIDISFCEPTLSLSLEWEVLPQLYGSDHFPILIRNETVDKMTQRSTPMKWKIDSANWTLFSANVEERVEELYNTHTPHKENMEEVLNKFSEVIIKAAEQHIGKTKQLNHRNPVPWWNDDCQQSLQQAHAAFNKYKKQKTTETLLEFKRLRAKCRQTTNKSKKKSWHEFVASINSSTPPTEVWRKIRKIEGKNTQSAINFLEHEGTVTANKKHIAEIMATMYEKHSSNDNFTSAFLDHKNVEETVPIKYEQEEEDPINLPITDEELNEALTNMKNSSPGIDDIPVIFLRNLPANAKKFLREIFNIIWLCDVFPRRWSEVIIIPILKPNKIKSNPDSYRPISLTCAMCKVLEKIINNRLVWTLEQQNLLAPEQSGFRKCRSTVDNLIDLESEIHESLANKQECIAIFFDISRAYDTAWRYNILNTLSRWNIRGNSLRFIRNFLKERRFQVRVDNMLSSSKVQENGTPQGSTLSVTLFLVAINDILQNSEATVRARLYADDLVIYSKGKNPKQIQKHLQTTLNGIEKWSNKTGFSFSSTKTKCMRFCRKQSHNPPEFVFHNNTLEYVESHKFLGMIFDQKLNWKCHIEHLKMTCQKSLNLMRVIAAKNLGADYSMLMRVYKSLIRSRIDYGCIVYDSAKKGTLKGIEVIHNTAIRIALGAYHTTPIESLLCEAGEPPLTIRRQYLSLVYAANVRANPSNPVYHHVFANRFREIYRKRKRSDPPFYERINRYTTALNITIPRCHESKLHTPPPWTINIPSTDITLTQLDKDMTNPEIINRHLLAILEKYENYLHIYTDASKTSSGVAAAFLTSNYQKAFKLPTMCNIHTGELLAILKALQYSNETNLNKCLILSDSLGAIFGLKQQYPDHPILKLIKRELHSLQIRRASLHFIWIPSHRGIAGNEAVDNLARAATTDQDIQITQLVVQNDAKLLFRQKVTSIWQQKWNNSNSKLQEIKPTVQPRKLSSKNRRQEIILTRLRLGHTRLTHEYLVKDSEAPICDVCGKNITVKHILIECTKFIRERQRHQIALTLADNFSDNSKQKHLISYLSDINFINEI